VKGKGGKGAEGKPSSKQFRKETIKSRGRQGGKKKKWKCAVAIQRTEKQRGRIILQSEGIDRKGEQQAPAKLKKKTSPPCWLVLRVDSRAKSL